MGFYSIPHCYLLHGVCVCVCTCVSSHLYYTGTLLQGLVSTTNIMVYLKTMHSGQVLLSRNLDSGSRVKHWKTSHTLSTTYSNQSPIQGSTIPMHHLWSRSEHGQRTHGAMFSLVETAERAMDYKLFCSKFQCHCPCTSVCFFILDFTP